MSSPFDLTGGSDIQVGEGVHGGTKFGQLERKPGTVYSVVYNMTDKTRFIKCGGLG